MKTTSTFFLLLISFFCNAQFSLIGRVLDKNNYQISYANVILLNQNNSIYRGTTTDEKGAFKIEGISEGSYILKISFIGYQEVTKDISMSSDLNFETIILNEDTESLEVVEVVAKRPTIIRKVDRLVFNIENTILSTGNAWEVLKKTPGLIVNRDNLMIKNSNNIIILINDKRVYLSNLELKNLLEGTTAEDITSVEVITNPPAKYEAEGSSVLNIKMKRNLVTGYKATIGGSFRNARYTRGSFFTTQYYKNEWLNFYANYNYNRGRGNRLEEEFIDFSNDNTSEIFHSNLDRNTFFKTHNFKINSEFNFNNKSSFTVGGQLYYSPDRIVKNRTSSEILTLSNRVDSSFLTSNNSEDFTKNLSLNSDYEIRFNEREKLNVTGYFTNYKEEGYQIVATDFFDDSTGFIENRTFITNSLQTTTIHSIQADYMNKKRTDFNFESGGKYSFVKSSSGLEHYNLIDEIPVEDINKTNYFKYSEQNISGYLSSEFKLGMLNFKAGLRGEYTHLVGNSITIDQKNKTDYFKLFPTVYVQYSPNENNQLSFNYGKRISRPNFSSLNPFKFYYADYSFYEGNPKLKPAISHNLELQYTLKNKYNFELYHNFQRNYITELNFQNNQTNELRYSFINVPKNTSTGIGFNVNYKLTNKWSFYTQHYLYENKSIFSALENENQLIKNRLLGYYGYFSTSYTFLKDKSLTIELNAYLVTDGLQGSMRIEGSEDISLGITKKMFKNKASLAIQISDIFQSQIVKVSTNYLNQNNYFIDNQETQYISARFRYSFGNNSLKTKNTKKIEEQNRL